MFRFFDVKFRDILDIPDLTISSRITVLVGASGSGKTTILRLLNKMISPTHGRILFHGNDIKSIPSVAHRRHVTMLSQNPAIFEGSIGDNLTIALRFQEREIPGSEDLNRILEQIQLNKELDSPAHSLSGGEKQRLALGRVLLLNPDVYLLDEPSSALDENTEDLIIQMLVEHTKRIDKSIVMVTHSRPIAEKYADEIIEIADGKIQQEGLK